MTREEAEALEIWIHDHDTRFEATTISDEQGHGIQLTSPEDGTRLPPIYRIEDYGAQHIEPGASPTIREKWAAWRVAGGAETRQQQTDRAN